MRASSTIWVSSKDQVEDVILAARVKAGWITEADLAPPPPEDEEGTAGDGEPFADGSRKRRKPL